MTHWIENDQTRALFWKTAQDQFGLGHEAVHEVLGIASLKDFTGTYEDAITALKRYEQRALDDALAAACCQLPESPVIAFTDVYSPAGFRWCITLRAGLPPDLAKAAVYQMVDLMKTFERGALAGDWEPANGQRGTARPAPAKPTATGATANQQPPASGNGTLTFSAEKLVATISDGNTYWKVKGGRFKQYGVTIWPEALAAAGFETDALDPLKPVDLAGYVAHYALNEEGKPQKVIKLERS